MFKILKKAVIIISQCFLKFLVCSLQEKNTNLCQASAFNYFYIYLFGGNQIKTKLLFTSSKKSFFFDISILHNCFYLLLSEKYLCHTN